MENTLILIRGVSGSGKTTLAKLLWQLNPDDVRFYAADDWMTNKHGIYEWDPSKLKDNHRKCEAAAFNAMGRSVPVVVVHNTFTRAWEMRAYEEAAEKHGYRVIHLIVEHRHDGVNKNEVPEIELLQHAGRFEVRLTPNSDEPQYLDLGLKDLIEYQKKVPQDPEWHPEGNNYNHIMIVLARALREADSMAGTDAIVLILAALFHDVGKIDTTTFHRGKLRLTAYNHDQVSLRYWEKWKEIAIEHENSAVEEEVQEATAWIIEQHMRAKFIDEMDAEKQAILRTHKWWDLLSRFLIYDDMTTVDPEEFSTLIAEGEESFYDMLDYLKEELEAMES